MTDVWHIGAKDLRRLRWTLVAWVAIIVARTLIGTVGADLALIGFGPQLGISEVSQLISVVYVVVLAFLISSLVHADPLVGRDAFWITRPIAPSDLMTAKLGFAALFFVIVPLLGTIVSGAYFGVRRRDIGSAVPVFLLNQLLLVMFLIACAAVTPSLARYVMTVVGAISAFVIFTASTIFVAVFWAVEVAEDRG